MMEKNFDKEKEYIYLVYYFFNLHNCKKKKILSQFIQLQYLLVNLEIFKQNSESEFQNLNT